ncbi:MAG: precorrin-2 dehydrogenase/sirohydrochlorin ferrochelatase family protein [Halanaerobiales bacterium]
MVYYPVNLNIRDKKILVVGGGKVAFRKTKRLYKCGSRVKVVCPELRREFRKFLDSKIDFFQYYKRKFRETDLEDIFMVIAATDDSEANKEIAKKAGEKGIMVNVVDNREISDFILPAVINRGDFLLTLSTSGNLPALSRKLREELEEKFGPEYELFMEEMSELRTKIIERVDDRQQRKQIFRKLADKNLIKMFSLDREKALSEVKSIIHKEIER